MRDRVNDKDNKRRPREQPAVGQAIVFRGLYSGPTCGPGLPGPYVEVQIKRSKT
jgi:hypothetical protein